MSLQSYDPGVTAMLAYATLLGMPLGDQRAATTLLVLGHSGDVVCSLSTDGDEPPQLHPIGGGGKGGKGGGKGGAPRLTDEQMRAKMTCRQNFCPSWVCDHPSCICRHDSTVDVESLDCSNGNKRFITLYRAYHRAHPDVATLQNVKLRVARGGKGGKGSGRGGGGRGGGGRGTGGSIAVISMRDMLAHGGDAAEFEAWLTDADCAGPGISALGGLDASDELEVHGEVVDAAADVVDVPGGDAPGLAALADGASLAVPPAAEVVDALHAARDAAEADADELARAR